MGGGGLSTASTGCARAAVTSDAVDPKAQGLRETVIDGEMMVLSPELKSSSADGSFLRWGAALSAGLLFGASDLMRNVLSSFRKLLLFSGIIKKVLSHPPVSTLC